MSSQAKWVIGILAVVGILMIGGQVAALFIGIPVMLAIYFGVLGIAYRVLGQHTDNPWKLAILAVILLATVFLCFWLASLTGWWD